MGVVLLNIYEGAGPPCRCGSWEGSKIFLWKEGTMGAEVLAIHEGAGPPSRWGSWEDSKIFSRPRGRLGGWS